MLRGSEHHLAPEFAAKARTAFPLGIAQSQTGFGFAAYSALFAIAA
tara:strand:- start:196 stop:333 length:138 start_codon:yes stop_codon:yes gene_type:complete